jgi:hypothetical protein
LGNKRRAMNWLKEIEVKDLLDGDVALIEETLGLDILILLWKEFPSINLYISTKPLVAAKKRYIRRFYNGSNIKPLARLLNCSDKFVGKVIAKKRVKGEFGKER